MTATMIPMDQYPRREHFRYFRSLSYPYVGVTADADVTELTRACWEKGCSFYLTFLHAAALAADDVPQFRQRIHGDGILEYDACPTSHIELKRDGAYAYCTLRHHLPLAEYLPYAEAARAACREAGTIQEDEDVDSMYFISTLPWVHYSAMIQPVAGGDESNPRITWGQYTENGQGAVTLPVTVLVHHALADGLHIAQFYDHLSRRTEETARDLLLF